MSGERVCRVLLSVVLGGVSGIAARAEVLEIRGAVATSVAVFEGEAAGDSELASDSYPDTSDALPLQVFARLIDPSGLGAGGSAAQFADPTELDQTNPEEFAVNLALVSESGSQRYTGSAVTTESRRIRFSASEVGSRGEGDVVSLTGLFFLDGALALFSTQSEPDLSGNVVTLRVLIELVDAEGERSSVYVGQLSVSGDEAGELSVSVGGDMPTETLIRTDLSSVVSAFPTFEVILVPSLVLDYAYEVEVGREYTLEASVRVEAETRGGEVGVAGIVGTPVDSLENVIAAVEGDDVAAKVVGALLDERAYPTGTRVVPAERLAPVSLPGCGMLGFESLLLPLSLVGAMGGARLRRMAG